MASPIPSTLAWMEERLTGHPWKCFEQPLHLKNEDALLGDPAVPHLCTRNIVTTDPAPIEGACARQRLWVIDSGHDLMITAPQEVADALFEIAARLEP